MDGVNDVLGGARTLLQVDDVFAVQSIYSNGWSGAIFYALSTSNSKFSGPATLKNPDTSMLNGAGPVTGPYYGARD